MREYAAGIEGLLGELGIMRAAIVGLDIPALVCSGSADPWSDHAVTAEIADCLKRPEVLVIDGPGHLPNLEAESEFNRALRAFLQAHAPGAAPFAAGGPDGWK
jgi:pimeloyl-ACP methyl ester carboxylesterase